MVFKILIFILSLSILQMNLFAGKDVKTNSFTTNVMLEEKGKEFEEVREFFKEVKAKEKKLFVEKAETPFRRFEVVFLISFPLIYSMSWFIMQTWVMIDKQDASAQLETAHWIFIISNSIVLSTYIASYDVYRVFYKDRKKEVRIKIPLVEARF